MPQGSALAARGSGTYNYKVIYAFNGSDGDDPQGSLIDVGGTLYGTTQLGGANYSGTVFSITTGGAEKVLYSFGVPPDGNQPEASLVNVRGTLYGTTTKGGANYTCGYSPYYVGCGTVFSVTTGGTEKVLHSFGGGLDGSDPQGALIKVKGLLYGTTDEGGAIPCYYTTCGTVFTITTSGTEKVLRSFNNRKGRRPLAGLLDVGGTLYGTAANGGAHRAGVVFRITPSGKEKVLYSFGGAPDGAAPSASLIDVKGTLYGTTLLGGAYQRGSGSGLGTVFSITPSGKEKVLHSFGNGTDGAWPDAPLIDVKGTLYGTTWSGGATYCAGTGCGTIFSITPDGTEKVLHSFAACSDGCCPMAGLTDVGGTLYGTATEGGAGVPYDHGTVFALTP